MPSRQAPQCNDPDLSTGHRPEATLLRALDAIDDMVVILHPDHTLAHVNRAMRNLLGTDKLIGRSCHDVFRDKIHTLANPADLEVFTTGAPVRLEVREPGLGGRWLHLNAYPDKDDAGNVRQVVVIVRDITKHKLLEEQLRHAQKMETVGRLAGGVAHDFNNLLTTINGHSELAHSRLDRDDPLQEQISEIRKAGERAASLVSQLLAFSRKQMRRPEPVDLKELINNMPNVLAPILGDAIRLKIHVPSDLGRVRADPGQIRQIITNLAANSRDAMPSGGDLTITTANVNRTEPFNRPAFQTKPGPYVAITVRDTGVGMDETTRAHLFEPFYTTKDSGRGAGLGLATVYAIVKQSGGHIDVESEPPKGAVVTVYLPRIMEAEDMPADPTTHTDPLRGTETILLVEDEDAVRKLAGTILRGYGYHVIEADNGVEALRICRLHQEPIHLLLSDVVLPRVSGPSVAERMVDFKPDTRILFMSGYTEESGLLQTILKQEAAFIPKPFTPDALAAKVREVLDAQPDSPAE